MNHSKRICALVTLLSPLFFSCGDDIIRGTSSGNSNQNSGQKNDDDPTLPNGEKPTCGNESLDPGELCDGDLFEENANVCPKGTVLPDGKSIGCTPMCTLNFEHCMPENCGNGVLDQGELCDGDLFEENANVCPKGTVLPDGKSIGCTPMCTLNFEHCMPENCGNGVLDQGELCDGDLFEENANVCPKGTVLPDGKSIGCTPMCTLNFEHCMPENCGNGDLDQGELCDGSKFADNARCPDGKRLPSGKSLACKADCTLDTSMCEDYCRTSIEYSNDWITGDTSRTNNIDIVDGYVSWDGNCGFDGTNSYATLTNGWKPYFSGRSSCLMTFNYEGNCPNVPNSCHTRIYYGSNWIAAPGNTNYYDNVAGVVTWNGVCSTDHATLSNGWTPYFNGTCNIAIRYEQCGEFFANPVIASDAPDPGVIRVGNKYYQVNTGGDGNGAYPLRISDDLKNWHWHNYAFPAGYVPSWADGWFWAPELHKVGDKYHIYYSARQRSNQTYAIGVGVSDKPEGPYNDIGAPLVSKPGMGLIDASYFKDSDGKHYVLWKDDGNAVGKKTPIYIQELSADGKGLVGSATEILTNTLSWEGALVEGPWLIKRGNYYYLFYSGNGYADARYALGVARSTSVRGTYAKRGDPIIKAQGYFQGPGHGSVLQTPSGEWVHVYHSWQAGKVDKYPPGRMMLVDRIVWIDDWPVSYSAPMRRSQPIVK